MTGARKGDRQGAGLVLRGAGSARVLGALAIALASVMFATDGSAQKTWTPIVVELPTPPAESMATPDAAPLPQMVDPRFFSAQRMPSPAPVPGVRDPLPQGAWSPIVTGAIPQPAGAAPATRTAPRAPSAGPGTVVAPAAGAAVPPIDALNPIRPLRTGTVAAAGGAEAASRKAAVADGVEAPPTGDEATPQAGANTVFKKPGPLDALPPDAGPGQQYCFNTADTAADARFAWQAKTIREMEVELEKRSKQLEAKTEEYKTWLAKRDEFSRKAHEKLVGFYARMRADAAAVQLATVDEDIAAAVLTKLETKVASQIMGEMDPVRAAKIAGIISGAAKIPPDRRRAADKAPPGGSAAGPADAESAAPSERPRS